MAINNIPAEDAPKWDLGYATAVIALAIALAGLAALLYFLLDILLVFFLGVVVAAALQPAHVRLSAFGVPKGLAVLLIYFLFIVSVALIFFFVVPVLVEQVSNFAARVPEQYTHILEGLRTHHLPLLRRLGMSLPSFDVLTTRIPELVPSFFDDLIAFMTSTITFFTYLVVVLVIGFYWTMEVPRWERLILSLFSVTRRPQVLGIWHEIEFKLGAFLRGQGLAMLVIGALSALGYWLIGLPNVVMLAVLAGLLEAIPIIGPILAAIPAVLIAWPFGFTTVLLVIGFVILLQSFESNILFPRIMNYVTGISTLMALFAILAFGTLYGVLGVFIAIPLTVVIQVLLDRMMIAPEPSPEATAWAPDPFVRLRAQAQDLRQQVRSRLRGRDSRMGIDPHSIDHLVDAFDQQIERAAERIETAIGAVPDNVDVLSPELQRTIIEKFQRATRELEQVLERVDTATATPPDGEEPGNPTSEPADLTELDQAAQRVEQAVQSVERTIAKVQDDVAAQGAQN